MGLGLPKINMVLLMFLIVGVDDSSCSKTVCCTSVKDRECCKYSAYVMSHCFQDDVFVVILIVIMCLAMLCASFAFYVCLQQNSTVFRTTKKHV